MTRLFIAIILTLLSLIATAQNKMRSVDDLINKTYPGWTLIKDWINSAKNRWRKWRDEVSKLNGDKVFNFYPFLWTKEGKDINKNSRKAIPIEEQYSLNLAMRKQLGLDK